MSQKLDNLEMRQAYANTLLDMARKDPRIVAIEADLSSSIGTQAIEKELPKQFVNCGIMEAQMVGTGAGFAVRGHIPFLHSFAPFASRRCYDQSFISIAYSRLNVKLFGSDPGVGTQYNGGTHTSFEDLALMTAVPKATVISMSDAHMMAQLVPQIAKRDGFIYFNALRGKQTQIYKSSDTFTIGKAKILREGSDITIVACGLMVAEALQAAEHLSHQGVQAEVIDMFTVKPLDSEALVQSARKTQAVITAENHQKHGGLGSAVAECLGEHCPVPLERVGVSDLFGQVGTLDFLQDFYGLRAEKIVEAVHTTLKRKK